MDAISAIVLLALVAMPIALLSGWFVDGGYGGLGSVVNRGDTGSWWRSTMPWPEGVQEDDELAWHVHEPEPAGDAAMAESERDAFELAPERPKAHVGVHAPGARLRQPR